MNTLAIIFVAQATPAGGDFPWAWAAFGAGMTLAIALVALGYRAGWFLPKYRLAEADPMQDKLTLKIFGPPEIAARSRRQAQVVPRYQLSGYRSDGFKAVRVAFGREFLIGSQCIYAARREDGTFEDQVLVARRQSSPASLSFQEQLNELHRNLAGMVRAFSRNAKEVQAARGNFRARLQGLKLRYDALYAEYRQHRSIGDNAHTATTQLTDFEVKFKDLNKRLDELK